MEVGPSDTRIRITTWRKIYDKLEEANMHRITILHHKLTTNDLFLFMKESNSLILKNIYLNHLLLYKFVENKNFEHKK